MSSEIATTEPQPSHFVIASNKAEMDAASERIAAWFRGKIGEERTHLTEMKKCLDTAGEKGIAVSGLARAVYTQRKRVLFHEKCLEAVEAGYSIIPNVDIDLIAIRTNATSPRAKGVVGRGYHVTVRDERAGGDASGEGAYKSPNQLVRNSNYTVEEGGKKVNVHEQWPTSLVDPEFPIAIANPALLTAAQEAMALKLFDEIGICRGGDTRRSDPMLIGRVVMNPGSYTRRTVSFVIAWWIDLRTL